MGKACITHDCYTDGQCCPDDFDLITWKCTGGVACSHWEGYPGTPPWNGICTPTSHQGPGVTCFGANCSTVTCAMTTGWEFMRFVPFAGNPNINIFAHEVGHHFGLAHTFDPPLERCYDQAKGTVPKTCGDPVDWPGTPVACAGSWYGCSSSNSPYRNIMSYFTDCNSRCAGDWSTTDWNVSLSQEQIAIVWRSLDEYWDRDLVSSGDTRLYGYGGFDRMQRAVSSGSREYRAQDLWSYMGYGNVGDAGWTKGNVRITQGDFNGDGNLDAIVYTPTGSHPGTTLWLRSSGSLYFAATLLVNSMGATTTWVGNVQSDWADDAVIQTSAGTCVYRGGVGATTMVLTHWATWPSSTHKIAVGNFGGTWELPVPMPYGLEYHRFDRHQNDIGIPRWNNLSHDDILVLSGTDAKVYYGSSTLDLTTAEVTSTSYNASAPGVWSGNIAGDYHDEPLIRWGNAVVGLAGQNSFSFGAGVDYVYHPSSHTVLISLGDFAGDHHADYLITSSYDGTRLRRGSILAPFTTTWTRPDLVPSNTRHAVADFVRGGRDDVMFFTTSGSWLYAGVPDPNYFTANVWYDQSVVYPNVEWFGRR